MLNDFVNSFNLNFGNPVGLGINFILSTLISGIILLIFLEIIGREFGEYISVGHVFLLALAINIINVFGLLGLIQPFVVLLPFAGLIILILPIVVWIVLVKLLFPDMVITHIIIVSIVGYLLTIFLVPYLVAIAQAYIPI